MPYQKTQNLLSLLCGALAGAAAMYLLDPETGQRRRQLIRRQAGDYLGSAGETLQSGWEKVAHRARDVGGAVAHSARDIGSAVADRAKEWTGAASEQAEDVTDYGNRLWGRVQQLGRRIGSRAEDLRDRARGAVERSTPLLPISLTGIGCCAIGAGLMYLMDPHRGHSRRARLADKITSFARRTRRSISRTGEDWRNRAYGMAAETRSKFQDRGPISSEQLLQRVRSEMGRAVSHPRLIQVMADANGTVTLTGRVLASESDLLISTVESVRGVNLVVNRMEVKNTEQELNAGQHPTQQSVPRM